MASDQTLPVQANADAASLAPVALATGRIDSLAIKLIVFFGGLTSVGTEICASRLVAPYFGDSTFIWANLIGLTLTYLSLGYWIGGKVADRFPRAWLLYVLTAVAAVWSGLVPFMSRPILSASLKAFEHLSIGAFYGSLVGVLLLFSVPITLLGFITPYAIRLRIHGVTDAGNVAGNTYALSTVGSIAGSFLPVLLLIPWIGTTRTFLVLALLLLVPSLVGLLLLHAHLPALGVTVGVALTLVALPLSGGHVIRPAEAGTLIYETESSDNYIQVTRTPDGSTNLILNDGHAVHSIYNPGQFLTGGPWDYFMVGSCFNPGFEPSQVQRALIIGLAGGTAARQMTAAYGPIPIDGVEIDPKIVEVGRAYFDMNEPNLNVIVNDGRYVLRTTDHRYDVIGVDAYRQPYIPFQLTTKEFFQEVRAHLTPRGVAVMNVGRTAIDYRLVEAMASTMKAVFPNVYLIDVNGYDNTMVIGTNAPTEPGNFAASVAGLPRNSPIRRVGETSLATGKVREWTSRATVFTDDHAPVEWVTNLIILDAAREEAHP